MGSQRFWLSRARRLAARRNLAAALDQFLPLALALSVLGAAALLVLRTWKISPQPIWFALGAALLLGAGVSWFLSRRRFLSTTSALVRLDEVGRLHNRLTAAQAGVGDWPEPRTVREPTHWNWVRLLKPLALAALLLIGAAWVPVPQAQESTHAVEPPLAWTQIESWLETLQESKLVEPEALQKLQEQLDGLRQQPAEEWYNQSSLEAGDSLRQQTEQSLRAMQDELAKSEAALAAAEKSRETLPPGELKALSDSLQNAARGLEMGNLPLNKELLSDLKKMDASKLKQLSQNQLEQMREKVKAGSKVVDKCVGPNQNLKPSMFAGEQGGGPGGGGGPAPLSLKQDATNLRTKETEAVSNDDVSRATPGDIMGVKKGEHEVKKVEGNGLVAGGAISSNGEGGGAVRRDSLTPQERAVLQRFFK